MSTLAGMTVQFQSERLFIFTGIRIGIKDGWTAHDRIMDCTSFALMENLGVTADFGFDEHFQQYGRFIVHPVL